MPIPVNPADQLNSIGILEEDPVKQAGYKKLIEFIHEIARATLIDAKINKSSTVKQGDYVVDLYEAGVPIDSDADPQPTKTDVPAYVIMKEDHDFDFDDGAWVKVYIVSQGFAIIPPPPLPRGAGFLLILTGLDHRKPSIAVWDHARFW